MNLSIKELKIIADRQYMVDILMDKNKCAEKILRNANFVNVVTKEIYKADIAIAGEYILMIGDCSKLIGKETQIIDLGGKYVIPGLIDAHMHFESAMLTITEFTRLSLPTGTTCLITDPHEIGNVLGPAGIKAMAKEAVRMPHHVYFRVPILTPDSPGLETGGHDITSKDLPEMLGYPVVSGIGEIQGVSAIKSVYGHNYNVIRDTIVSTVYAKAKGYGVDGNAPELFREELAAHIIAGGTDISCHETTTKEEAIEKLRYGIYMLMREGSTQRNMPECIKAIKEENLDSRRAILATDDMLAEDIASKGHMNDIIKRTIKEGINPIEAIQMATINPAIWLGLSDIGVLTPGKLADLVVIDGKLGDMKPSMVFLRGQLVAQNEKLLINLPPYTYSQEVKFSVKRKNISPDDLKIKASKNYVTVRCIGLIVNQNLTHAVEVKMNVKDGFIKPNLKEDLLPIAVVGRYDRNNKNIGKTFVKGFGMKRGAIAESVSHDTHNIIVMGTNYNDMALAVNRIIEIQGGIVVVVDGKVREELSLPVAGLITDELNSKELIDKMENLHSIAEKELGCKVHAPFMHLAFLSLTTSPKWKITDKGIVDANNYCIVPTIIN